MNLFEAMPKAFGDSGETSVLRERLAEAKKELDGMRYKKQLEPKQPFREQLAEFWDRPQAKLLATYLMMIFAGTLAKHSDHGSGLLTGLFFGSLAVDLWLFIKWIKRQYSEAGFLSVALKLMIMVGGVQLAEAAGMNHVPVLDIASLFADYLIVISKLSDVLIGWIMTAWESEKVRFVRRAF